MRHILTIEDHAGIRQLIRITLQFEGHQIIEAVDGDSGIAAALKHRPDLILVDVLLPGRMDGLQVCRQIRQNAAIGDLPIILLTALNSPQDRQKGVVAGANAYLTKPFRPLELIDTVARMLRQEPSGASLP